MANETLEALWNRRQPRRRRRAPSPKQELVPTFYSKLPSFDDCEEGSYQWDLFWRNAPYIGRGRFMKDRDSYDQNGVAWRNEKPPKSIAYWDDVDPNDFYMVQQRSAIPANVIIEVPTVRVVRTNQEVPVPEYKTEGSAGMDLAIANNHLLRPGEGVVAETGVRVKIPPGYFGKIEPRSSLAVAGLTTDAGVIDEDYTGEL